MNKLPKELTPELLGELPIYRAKKIDSDVYIVGSHIYSKHENTHWIRYEMPIRKGFSAPRVMTLEIDPSTLSISFPDMLDSEGTRIFASLSEDGKGGDMLEAIYTSYRVDTNDGIKKKYDEHVKYSTFTKCGICNTRNKSLYGSIENTLRNADTVKVTGIQHE